jgi:hypothetical protein
MPALTTSAREKLNSWFAELRDDNPNVWPSLYLDMYVAHSGSGGKPYLVGSVDDLEKIIGQQSGNELQVCVFRGYQYSIRIRGGVTPDMSLLKDALQTIPEGEWFQILSIEYPNYPFAPDVLASGNSHVELRQALMKLVGRVIAVSQNPFDGDDNWVYTSPDKVMVLNLHREKEGFVFDT